MVSDSPPSTTTQLLPLFPQFEAETSTMHPLISQIQTQTTRSSISIHMDQKLPPYHNVVPFLGKFPFNREFHEIIDFLRNCNLSFALTVNPYISQSLLLQFWEHASAVRVNGKVPAIQSVIGGRKVQIHEANLRLHLNLKDDSSGMHAFDKSEVDQTFRDLLGYAGPVEDKRNTIFKHYFEPKFRFLIHTVLQTFSKKRANWEQVPVRVQFLIHSLVRNLNFNVSRYLLDDLLSNLRSDSRFLMYPRFLMVVLIKELGEIFQLPMDSRLFEPQSDAVFSFMKGYKKHSRRSTPLPPTMVLVTAAGTSAPRREEGADGESGGGSNGVDELQSRIRALKETVDSLIAEHHSETERILAEIASIRPKGIRRPTIDLESTTEDNEVGRKEKGESEVIVIDDDDDVDDDDPNVDDNRREVERKRKGKEVMVTEEEVALSEDLGFGRKARILDNLEGQLQEIFGRRGKTN